MCARRSCSLRLALVLGWLCLGGCQSPEPAAPLVLATVAMPSSAAIHLAVEQGLLGPEQVQLRLYSSGRDALAAMLAGEADLATTSETPIVHSLLGGERPRIIASLAIHQNMISIVADRAQGIQRLEDLVGKRVAAAPSTNAEYFVHCLASYHQLPSDVIEVVPMENDAGLAALAAGEISALATWSPFREEAQGLLGDRAVVLSDPAVYSGTWNLVAPVQHPADDPRLRHLLLGLIQVSQSQLSSPSPEVVGAVAQWAGMDPGAAARNLQALRFDPRLDQSLLLLMEDQGRWQDPSREHLQLMEAFDPRHIAAIDRGRVTFIQ